MSEIKLNRNRHKYFMDKALLEATMNTCPPRSETSPNGVGAVLVRGNRTIASGYNGAPPKAPQCDEVGHELVNDHCVRTIHAEHNAILQCARFGIACEGAVMYTTVRPCYDCLKMLAGAGISKVYYKQNYNSRYNMDEEKIQVKAKELGIELMKLEL